MDTNTSICPVCGTPIENNDPKIVCPECKVTFHEECWQDNKGCSTYGCKQVNVLNPPMKVDIPQSEQTEGTSRDQMLQLLAARLNRGEINQVTYQRIYAEITSASISPSSTMPTFEQPLSSPNYSVPQIDNSMLLKIKFSFKGWWILGSIVTFLSFLSFLSLIVSQTSNDDPTIFDFISLLFGIPWIIFGCMLFYRLWNITLPEVRNDIGPGNATVSFFIPFYNIYWFPVGYYKLANNIHQTLIRQGCSPNVNVAALGGLAGGLCVLSSCISATLGLIIFYTWIDIIGFILLLFYYHSLIKAVETISNSQQNISPG
jgi:uncharacterized membrane protein YjfL (UPF0719 family)/uncharacterized Zn finger protein (UPF0148 family)